MKLSEDELRDLKSNPAVLAKIFAPHLKLEKQDAGRWRAACPFGQKHANGRDRTPSFDVWKADDGTWVYKCLGCNSSGNCVQFVQNVRGVSFGAALKEVQETLAGTWHEGAQAVDQAFPQVVKAEEKTYTTFPVSHCQQFVDALRDSKEARAFLRKRCINFETAEKLRIGFRQSVKSKQAPERLQDAGWLVFPYIENDKVVRVKFRSIVEKVFVQQPGMRQTGLYNSECIDMLAPAFWVEGELDVAALVQAGFAAASLFNATHVPTVADKDLMMSAESLYLAGDCDEAAGEEKMVKLWNELNAFRIKWPGKDANQLLMESGSTDEFRRRVEKLMQTARTEPMPSVYSLQEAMLASGRTDMMNHPKRLHMPWQNVDEMAVMLPGSVMAVTASSSGMGKTCWTMNISLHEALRGETILNYQAELNESEFSNMVAAHVLKRDRNELTREDYREAVDKIRNVKYYVGCNPDLNTSAQVMSLLEKAIQRLSPSVVILDHLHHVCRGTDSDINDQSNVMQKLKSLSQKYGLKMIVVAQPRKANQQNKGKVIDVSDFKGSEAIVSGSDVVMVLHRDPIRNADPAAPPDDAFANETAIWLKKGRTKGRGKAVAQLNFRGNISTFYEVLPQSSGFQTGGNDGV